MAAADFNSQAFSPMHQRGGFTRWMHHSTSQIGDMARDGYFDNALAEGYPVKPGHMIDVLAGRSGATPRTGQFVVDDITNGRITVTARNMGQIADAGSRFFGLPADNNTQYFKDMLDNPGIYSVPVGNWRIPDMNGYVIQPGVYTFIGVDPEHCILDFSESTAVELIRLALGTGYKIRLVNVGLKGAGTAQLFDLDNHANKDNPLPFDSLVIDELLFDNVNADLWDSVFHADPGRFETPSNQGTGAGGDFLTIKRMICRRSQFTNIWDCPIELEMGKLFDCQYNDIYMSDIGQQGIANGFLGEGGGRQHQILPPGLLTGDKLNPDPDFPRHPLGEIARVVISNFIIRRVGIIAGVAQPPGDRSTNAINTLGDSVVIGQGVIDTMESEAGGAANSEGIYNKSHGVSVSGVMMIDAGLSESFMRLTGGPHDQEALSTEGEIGMCSVTGCVLIETRGIFTGGGSNYTKSAGIDVSNALVNVSDCLFEGFPKYAIRTRGHEVGNTTEDMVATRIAGIICRKCGDDTGAAGADNGIINIGGVRRNISISDIIFERPGQHEVALLKVAKAHDLTIRNVQAFVEDQAGAVDQAVIGLVVGDETLDGVRIYDNYANFSDTFIRITGDVGAELTNFVLRDNRCPGATAAVVSIDSNVTLTNAEIHDNPGYLDGSKTHDFGTVNAGTTGATTLTVTDAAAGDAVRVRDRSGGLAAGLMVYGRVTAADTVTLYCANVTAGNIAVGSLVYDVWVERRRNPA